MRARTFAAAAAALLLVGGFAYAASSGPDRPPMFYSGTMHGDRPAPHCLTLTPPCPPAAPHGALSAEWMEPEIGMRFLAPLPGAVPAVDPTEALDIAWQEGGIVGTSQQATLAVVPAGGSFPLPVLVWVVRYDGGCIAPAGRPSSTSQVTQCQRQPYWTVIDAESGRVHYELDPA